MTRRNRWSWRVSIVVILLLSATLWLALARLLRALLG